MNSADNLRGGTSIDALPSRPLGRIGKEVSILGLGGEGILRTHGETARAIRVLHRALELGIPYCDTAPAYASSRDYYGAALGERRQQVFLASKTHDRSRDGSLRLLDDSLLRLRTDHLVKSSPPTNRKIRPRTARLSNKSKYRAVVSPTSSNDPRMVGRSSPSRQPRAIHAVARARKTRLKISATGHFASDTSAMAKASIQAAAFLASKPPVFSEVV